MVKHPKTAIAASVGAISKSSMSHGARSPSDHGAVVLFDQGKEGGERARGKAHGIGRAPASDANCFSDLRHATDHSALPCAVLVVCADGGWVWYVVWSLRKAFFICACFRGDNHRGTSEGHVDCHLSLSLLGVIIIPIDCSPRRSPTLHTPRQDWRPCFAGRGGAG